MKKILRHFALAFCIATVCSPIAVNALEQNDDAAIVRNLDIFNNLYKELNTFYVDTIDVQKNMEIAIAAMLDNIDPYTEYIPAKNQEDFMVISTGEYGGIGSYIMQRKGGGVYISEPYKNSPAAKAGLKPGDHIIMIDNDTVAKWSSDSVSAKLKGQANTKVKVTIARPYATDSIMAFDITREKIKMDPVQFYGVVRGNIGYINLNTFNEHSPEQVKNALLEFKKNPAVKYIVLDLRGNGGGLLESAVQIVGMFVPKGTQVLQTRGRNKQQEKTYKTTQEPIDTEIPLVVMIDGGSASSAETRKTVRSAVL